jgi:hypothetical protein
MTSHSSNTAVVRSGTPPKLIRFVLTIVIATVFGPLVSGVTVFLMFAAMLIAQWEFNTAGMGESFILMVGVAYLAGWVIAVVTGTIVALVALWRPPNFAVVLLAVLVANVGYFALTESQLFHSAGGSPKPLQGIFVSLAFSIYAANVCWLLFRRFVKNLK